MTCCFSVEVPVLLREKLLSAMATLGLYGMKATFDELIATGISRTPHPQHPLPHGDRKVPGGEGSGSLQFQ